MKVFCQKIYNVISKICRLYFYSSWLHFSLFLNNLHEFSSFKTAALYSHFFFLCYFRSCILYFCSLGSYVTNFNNFSSASAHVFLDLRIINSCSLPKLDATNVWYSISALFLSLFFGHRYCFIVDTCQINPYA